jgi:SOS-response transcriptional repressor LexA
MLRLTHRQAQVLDYIEREPIPPTLREIGRELDIKSTNGVNDHLRALERKGRIACATDSRSRHIQVLLPLTDDERAVFSLGRLHRCESCNQVLPGQELDAPARPPPTPSNDDAIVERVSHG